MIGEFEMDSISHFFSNLIDKAYLVLVALAFVGTVASLFSKDDENDK